MNVETLNLATCRACNTVYELKQIPWGDAADISSCVKCGGSYTQFDPCPALDVPIAGSILDANFVIGR